MPIEVTMPRLSDTMETGTVIKWNVKEGDSVAPGDVLADIETDKATMELQAFDEGTVARILLAEGDAVAVGSAIMLLAEEGEEIEAAESSSAGAPAAHAQAESTSKTGESKPATATTLIEPSSSGSVSSSDASSSDRVFASPLARKIASEQGLDLTAITGSGPSGRIVRRDVEALMRGEAPAAAPATQPAQSATPTSIVATPISAASAVTATATPGLEAATITLGNMRRTIARRLVESKTTIPHYQVTVTADMDTLLDLRRRLNEQLAAQGVKLSVNDFLVRACALAMLQHPFINSRWRESGDDVSIEILPAINIGIAIALPAERGGGLVVATLRGADQMGLRQISAQTKALAEKARTRGLTVEEMADSTFTISNLGMFGVDHFTAIINPPNAAILAVGAALETPVVREGAVTIGHTMSMTMSSDHRVIDGAMAATYLKSVKEALERPATLLV